MADTNAQGAVPVPPIDISKITFETVSNRRRIIASYWLVVLFAIPLWWKTTSIDRLSLPESRVHGFVGKQVCVVSCASGGCLTRVALLQLSFPVNINVRAEQNEQAAHALSEGLRRYIVPIAESNGIAVNVNDRSARVSVSV